MEIDGIIIAILWSIISLLVIIEYAPVCKNLSWRDQLIVVIILAIGGPILTAASILEIMLNYILPEGWGDDNDFKRY